MVLLVKIDAYTDEFKEEYWKAVNKEISKEEQKQIMKSCIKFLPRGFFEPQKVSFKHLVLAQYSKLKQAQCAIENENRFKMKKECFKPIKVKNKLVRKDLYQTLYKAYDNIAKSEKDGASMRVRMVRAAEITVCPYCNRDYINCRADNVSGAQLDHFFNRAEYPIFAVCLYNLVPVCGNCNRVKSAKVKSFVSPFDETMDWENLELFTYDPKSISGSAVVIKDGTLLEENIKEMKIRQAYEIHDKEVKALLERKEFYSKSQVEEFKKVLCKMTISDEEMKKMIFGPQIRQEDMRTKPLGKMMHDLHKELKIYYT